MNKPSQIKKAEKLLALHHDPKLLILPNIWEPLGARLIASLGFPAVATASAAIAFSQCQNDGEEMTFFEMLRIVELIAEAVDVPVTADMERGYGETPDDVANNMYHVLQAGVVGINIEDSLAEGSALRSIDEQCARILAIRTMADAEGIPLVINARCDAFLSTIGDTHEEQLTETITRGKAYRDAGADCFYPITLGDVPTLEKIIEGVKLPVNVYASANAASLKDLESIGVSRVSTGPGLLKAALGTMRSIAHELQNYGEYNSLTKDIVQSGEILKLIGDEN